MNNSRIPGFYNLPLDERLDKLADAAGLAPGDISALQTSNGLMDNQADRMVENAVGTFGLPLGIGLNFIVNGKAVLVPMAIEEPSVVAGASFMAKLAGFGGGFTAVTSAPEMIGQMQVLEVKDLMTASMNLYEHKAELLAEADEADPVLKKLGGGARDLEVRIIEDSPIGLFLVVHLIYDVRDAMGANAVNTACEKLAPRVEEITGGRVHLRSAAGKGCMQNTSQGTGIHTGRGQAPPVQRRTGARRNHPSLGVRSGGSLSRRNPQQGHHERGGCGGDCHRE
jgi:hydroxymethylglutaryl-CoA reductase